jgi:hypothetical protein
MKPRLIIASIALLVLVAGMANAQQPAQGSGQSQPPQQDQNAQPTPSAKPSTNGRVPVSADDLQKYVVSAKAGGVNVADGDVTCKSGNGDWKIALVGDQLNTGDSVRTGADSRAEILLTPGSYLRLTGNTEIKMDNTAYDSVNSVKVSLIAGSIIVESGSAEDGGEVVARISTAKSSFAIVNAGVYRFDADANGGARVLVEKGKLAVDGSQLTPMKTAIVDSSGGKLDVESVNKKSLDAFDTWSQERASSLVASNAALQSPTVNAAPPLLYGFGANLRGGCGGQWLFDPFIGGFTYLPSAVDPYSFGYQYGFGGGGLWGTSYGFGGPYAFAGCPQYYSGYGYGYGVAGYPRVPVIWRKPVFGKLPGGKKQTLAVNKPTLAEVVTERGAAKQNRSFSGGGVHPISVSSHAGGYYGGASGHSSSSAGRVSGGTSSGGAGHVSSSSAPSSSGSAAGGHH